ncbi:factor-independent urate hydroxylase [Angustibacter sp. McL0619]|uniref:factor-independent urate hydroxylase n=1 Tax=Angustibacter sp. McL0619 TaxID=3415676 RepID=UPI003CEF87C7
MAIVLGQNQYGKAESRVVHISRNGPRHEIRDLNVSTSLRGDFAAAHLDGDQRNVLPTDSQKNAAFAFARQYGVDQIEDYALLLAGHFVDDVEPVRSARVTVQELGWQRASFDGVEHNHTWVRSGPEVRFAEATVEGSGGEQRLDLVSGLDDLVLLKSTGSEFAGFLHDEYTTLAETHDRVLATSLVARWRHTLTSADWATSYADVRRILVEQFASVHSLALQQTLWHMGRAVLQAHPLLAEIRLSAPNKHHFLVDLAPFGLDNPGEVYLAADRPYGLIEATVTRDDA